MKRSHVRQILFTLVLFLSFSSYLFLNSVQPETTSFSTEQGVNPEEKQEALLPDMALIKKLIDVSRFFTTFVH